MTEGLHSSTDVPSTRHSILSNQASVTVRLFTGVSRGEFAFLARPCATSRALDSLHLYLFERRLLGLHGF